MAEREIEFAGIVRIQLAKRRRDVGGHLPARARITRQSKAPPDANDVRVERHYQLRGGYLIPDSKIDRVASDHPSQEEVQPLARTAARRPREEVRDAWTRLAIAIGRT